ncbi:MAG: serine/threonine protein kinase [Chitinispirillaceae bacterium]|nr:serine/threonine protein kinase [Chitinispirillaceae bacterium]
MPPEQVKKTIKFLFHNYMIKRKSRVLNHLRRGTCTSNTTKRYCNLHKIAEGGTGAVYYGTERSRNRKVVLKKRFYEQLAHPFNFKRFDDEAAILTSLYHDSIIRTYDYGESEESLYIAMEYVDGPDLEKLLSWPGFHRDIGLMVGFQALQGLHFAHGKDITHCDIKPSNILISQNGKVKLSDFGLSQSKVFSTHLEDMKHDLTAALFMPPEQAKMVLAQSGIEHDAWAEIASMVFTDMSSERNKGIQCDIWSVGVLLYRICGGTYPFSGEDLAGILNSIIGKKEKNIQELAPDLPQYLAQAISACLEKEAYKRPISLAPLLAALQRYFSRMSVGASEMAIQYYISAYIHPNVMDDNGHHDPRAEKKIEPSGSNRRFTHVQKEDELFAIPVGERDDAVSFERQAPDKLPVPGREKQERAAAGPKSSHHLKLLLAGIIIVSIVVIGMLCFWLVHHNTGTADWIENAPLTAADILPEREDAYMLAKDNMTEQTGTIDQGSRQYSKRGTTGITARHGSVSEDHNAQAKSIAVGKKTITTQPSDKSADTDNGILKLTIQPADARVFIDGKEASYAELATGASVNAGTYGVVAHHPEYESYHGKVRVDAEKTEQVSIVLSPRTKEKGQLHVYSYPWAEIYIDGIHMGTAPTPSPISLTVGEHTALLKRDGYQLYKESVQIIENEVTRLQITLNKADSP